MSINVTVIDYNRGNLFSVVRALEHCGAVVRTASDPQDVADAERVVLPGVGAFGDAMAELRARDLIEPLRRYAASGRPFLGICLGMQIMFESSQEFGHHDGLALLRGEVVPIPRMGAAGMLHKVPHIGWAPLMPAGRARWTKTLLDGIPPSCLFYFVHSYMVVPADANDRIADAGYNGLSLCAVAGRDRLWGCQFHPEKSGEAGLTLLRNFLSL